MRKLIKLIIATVLIYFIFPINLHSETTKVNTKVSYYAARYEGRKMANGTPYHANKPAAAFNRWPLGTTIAVINPANGIKIVLQITDRKIGPALDLNKTFYNFLGFTDRQGWGRVIVIKIKE